MSNSKLFRKLVDEFKSSNDSTHRIIGLLDEFLEGSSSDSIDDSNAGSTLLEISQVFPQYFRNEKILSKIFSSLEGNACVRRNQNLLLESQEPRQILSGMLIAALRGVKEWPMGVITAYMIDSLGNRVWVDHPACDSLISNIKTAWDPISKEALSASSNMPETAPLSKSSSMNEGDDSSSGEEMDVESGSCIIASHKNVSISPRNVNQLEPSIVFNDEELLDTYEDEGPLVADRFRWSRTKVHTHILQHVVSRLLVLGRNTSSHAHLGIFTNFYRGTSSNVAGPAILTLANLCTLPVVRTLGAINLSEWISSVARSAPALKLLNSLAENLFPQNRSILSSDISASEEIFSLKPRPNLKAAFHNAIKLLVERHPNLSRRLFVMAFHSSNPSDKYISEDLIELLESAIGAIGIDLATTNFASELCSISIEKFFPSSTAYQNKNRKNAGIDIFLCILRSLSSYNIVLNGGLFAKVLLTEGVKEIHDKNFHGNVVSEFLWQLATFARIGLIFCVNFVQSQKPNSALQQRIQPTAKGKSRLISQESRLEIEFKILYESLYTLSYAHTAIGKWSAIPDFQKMLPILSRIESIRALLGLTGGPTAPVVPHRGVLPLVLPSTKKYEPEVLQKLYKELENFEIGIAEVANREDLQAGLEFCMENRIFNDILLENLVGLVGMEQPYCPMELARIVLETIEMSILTAAKTQVFAESLEIRLPKKGKEVSGQSTRFKPSDSLQIKDSNLVEAIFSLTRCHYEPGTPLAGPKGVNLIEDFGGERMDESTRNTEALVAPPAPLAYVDLFWRACLTSLILAATNPSTVGRWAWDMVPTLRCFMQMVVCSQYEFPPPGAMPSIVQFHEESQQKRSQNARALMLEENETCVKAERDLIDLLCGSKKRKKCANNTVETMTGTKRNKILSISGMLRDRRSTRSMTSKVSEDDDEACTGIFYSDFIGLDLSGPARTPPRQILDKLKELDKELNLGARLRRCKEPDFIIAVAAGSDPQRVTRGSTECCAEWLVSALAAEPDVILRRLPLDVATHLALMAHLPYSVQDSDKDSTSNWSISLRKILVPHLLGRVARAAWGSDSYFAIRAFELLSEDLSHTDENRRDAARKTFQHVIEQRFDFNNTIVTRLRSDSNPIVTLLQTDSNAIVTPLPIDLTNPMEVDNGDEVGSSMAPVLSNGECVSALWMLDCVKVPCWSLCYDVMLKALNDALKIESCLEALYLYLAALLHFSKRILKDGDSKNFIFCHTLCIFLSERPLIGRVLFEQYKDLVAIALEHVSEAISYFSAMTEKLTIPWETEASAVFAVNTHADSDSQETRVNLPVSLVKIALSLLVQSCPENSKKDRIFLENSFFPEEGGISTAVLITDRKTPILDLENWISLIKYAAPNLKSRCLGCMPVSQVPRVFFISGLDDQCIMIGLNRLNSLAEAGMELAHEAYTKYLSDTALYAWGNSRPTGTRTILLKRLLSRLDTYNRLHCGNDEQIFHDGPFMMWLRRETLGIATEAENVEISSHLRKEIETLFSFKKLEIDRFLVMENLSDVISEPSTEIPRKNHFPLPLEHENAETVETWLIAEVKNFASTFRPIGNERDLFESIREGMRSVEQWTFLGVSDAENLNRRNVLIRCAYEILCLSKNSDNWKIASMSVSKPPAWLSKFKTPFIHMGLSGRLVECSGPVDKFLLDILVENSQNSLVFDMIFLKAKSTLESQLSFSQRLYAIQQIARIYPKEISISTFKKVLRLRYKNAFHPILPITGIWIILNCDYNSELYLQKNLIPDETRVLVNYVILTCAEISNEIYIENSFMRLNKQECCTLLLGICGPTTLSASFNGSEKNNLGVVVRTMIDLMSQILLGNGDFFRILREYPGMSRESAQNASAYVLFNIYAHYPRDCTSIFKTQTVEVQKIMQKVFSSELVKSPHIIRKGNLSWQVLTSVRELTQWWTCYEATDRNHICTVQYMFLRSVSTSYPLIFLGQSEAIYELLKEDAYWQGSVKERQSQEIQPQPSTWRDRIHPPMLPCAPFVLPSGLYLNCEMPVADRTEGMRELKLGVRFWGYSYTYPLWENIILSYMDIPAMLLVGEVGDAVGVRRIWELYLELMTQQLEFGGTQGFFPIAQYLAKVLPVVCSNEMIKIDKWTAFEIMKLFGIELKPA